MAVRGAAVVWSRPAGGNSSRASCKQEHKYGQQLFVKLVPEETQLLCIDNCSLIRATHTVRSSWSWSEPQTHNSLWGSMFSSFFLWLCFCDLQTVWRGVNWGVWVCEFRLQQLLLFFNWKKNLFGCNSIHLPAVVCGRFYLQLGPNIFFYNGRLYS